MSIKSYPFTSVSGDRVMTAADFRSYWAAFGTDGVIKDVLDGCSGSVSGLVVTISPGMALIQGALAIISEAETVTLTAAQTARYATVALEYNTNAAYRDIHLTAVYGTASAPAETTRAGNVWQLPLYTVLIPANASSLGELTDARTYAKLRMSADYEPKLADNDTIKSAPVDNDAVIISDSADDNTTKKVLFSVLKSLFKTTLSDAVNSTSNASGGTAATPYAVKQAYDKADSALPKAGGTLTGVLKLTNGVHYGTSLPSAGQAGRIFFRKV